MKTTAALLLSLVLLLPSTAAWAHHHHHGCRVISSGDCGSSVVWARRCPVDAGRFAITSTDRKVDLLLDRREVILQLSDRTMHRIDRDLRDERDREEGFLADAIKGAVIDAVRSLLDHSLRCPLDEVRDARYEDGRLVLVTRDHDELFDRVNIDDGDVMASFSAADARAFIAEFRRLKAARS